VEPTSLVRLSGYPVLGSLLVLPANIRLGWKGLPGTNTNKKILYVPKKFYNVGPRNALDSHESVELTAAIFAAGDQSQMTIFFVFIYFKFAQSGKGTHYLVSLFTYI
jgi:hypothetical protein